jgi:glutamine synthetase
VAAFAADALVERTLGRELRDEFILYKTQEWHEYHLSITQWEVDRYSHMF